MPRSVKSLRFGTIGLRSCTRSTACEGEWDRKQSSTPEFRKTLAASGESQFSQQAEIAEVHARRFLSISIMTKGTLENVGRL